MFSRSKVYHADLTASYHIRVHYLIQTPHFDKEMVVPLNERW